MDAISYKLVGCVGMDIRRDLRDAGTPAELAAAIAKARASLNALEHLLKVRGVMPHDS